jgi:predicted alpha/beta-fold hydrolase
MMARKKELYPELYDLRDLQRIRTVRQFDELFTAPHGGFSDAKDYYAKSSVLPLFAKIRAPTLILHARDDPMVPLAPFLSTEASENSNVLVVTPHHGGHVGFVSGNGKLGRSWAEAIVVRFCRALSSPLESRAQTVYGRNVRDGTTTGCPCDRVLAREMEQQADQRGTSRRH